MRPIKILSIGSLPSVCQAWSVDSDHGIACLQLYLQNCRHSTWGREISCCSTYVSPCFISFIIISIQEGEGFVVPVSIYRLHLSYAIVSRIKFRGTNVLGGLVRTYLNFSSLVSERVKTTRSSDVTNFFINSRRIMFDIANKHICLRMERNSSNEIIFESRNT